MTVLRPDTPAHGTPARELAHEAAAAAGTGVADPLAGAGVADPLAGPPDVVASGVLCWRHSRDHGGLEVLLVHRPGYDDWGWPKGKPDRRESLTECAVREAAEETGIVAVLGRPLSSVRYRLPDGRLKEVVYWAARPVGQGRSGVPDREVEAAEWLPVDVAADRVTHTSDAGPLATLAGFADEGTLATQATLIVRHATARPRDSWARADGERPLVASGKRQAMALAALLQCWRPETVLCSPWRRCMQTMEPYAAASGVRVRTKGGLTEDGHRRSPAKARRHTHRLLDSPHGGALCTHRPVLVSVMRALRERSVAEVVPLLPDSNPYLHPGEVLVAHVGHGSGAPRIVAVERHEPR